MFGKKKLIDGLEKKLAGVEAELKASQDLLKDSEHRLTEFQKRAYAEKTELISSVESKEAEIKKLAEDNKALKSAKDLAEKAKAEASSKLKAAESALESAKSGLDAKTPELESLKSSLSAKESEIKALKGDVAAKESEIASIKNEMAAKVSEVESVKSALATEKSQVSTLEKALEMKDSEILKTREALESFKSLAEEKDAKLSEAEKTLKSFQEMVEKNKVTSSGVEKELKSLNEANAESEEKIAQAAKRFDDAMEAADKAKTYDVTFVADGKVISKAVMASEEDAYLVPQIPQKEGFDAEWQYEETGENDVVVTAVYKVKEYDLVFFVDDVKYAEMRVAGDDMSGVPPVPEKEDYEGEWVKTLIDGNSARIDAFYKPKEYDIRFYVDGKEYVRDTACAGSDYAAPAVPEREDYKGEWQYEVLDDGTVRVDAVYEPTVYDLVFFVDDVKYAEMKASADAEVDVPPVPEREDCEGEWVQTLIDGNTARIDAFYKPKVYDIAFYVDGKEYARASASSDSGFSVPEVPEKEDYKGEWQYEVLDDGTVRVDAVYEPTVYDLVFFVDDVKYAEMKASADAEVDVPPVPEREDCEGEWVQTFIDGNTARIDAFYKPKVYDLKFYVDGEEYAETTASIDSDFAVPEVPEKENFKGEWQYEVLDDGTVRLDAQYAPTAYELFLFVDDVKYAEMTVPADEDIVLPPVPEKEDYRGEWAYTVIDGNTTRIDAIYTPVKYLLQFFADGEKVFEAEADADSGFQPPEVPYKEDYDGEWQYEPCKDGVVKVDAVYTPTVYDLVFFVDDVKYDEMKFCPAEGSELPPVPEREGFVGEWTYTTIDGSSARIDALYTPLSGQPEGAYHVTFYVDGEKYMEKDLTSDEELESLPPVPHKEDYAGRWEYTETGDDSADIVAVYEPIDYKMVFYVDGEKYAEAVMNVEDGPEVVPQVPAKPGFTGEWHYSKEDDTVIVTAVYTAE